MRDVYSRLLFCSKTMQTLCLFALALKNTQFKTPEAPGFFRQKECPSATTCVGVEPLHFIYGSGSDSEGMYGFFGGNPR